MARVRARVNARFSKILGLFDTLPTTKREHQFIYCFDHRNHVKWVEVPDRLASFQAWLLSSSSDVVLPRTRSDTEVNFACEQAHVAHLIEDENRQRLRS